MKVNALRFENYRNLSDNTIFPCESVNVIYGDNAQGKTNLLEALWLFCGGHSFRGSKDSEAVCWGKGFSRLDMRFYGQEREQSASILIQNGKKQVEINGVQKSSAAALIERYCAVVFAPDHLGLIKRGPSERRKFIDSAVCREKLRNAVSLSKYNRALAQRNSLLKEIYRNPNMKSTLGVWDEPLAMAGALVIKNRLEYIAMLSERAEQYHKGISRDRESLETSYVSSLDIDVDSDINDIKNALLSRLEKSVDEDIRAGFTNHGPHRDDIEIKINGRNARSFASQGQQRSAVLSLKLAEASVLRQRMGEQPVILLDDVLSELDNSRQDFLLNELKDCQVFITCCEKSNKEQLRNGKVFQIKNGEVL